VTSDLGGITAWLTIVDAVAEATFFVLFRCMILMGLEL
jgi:hypothetical protein